jgi:hypothetical protein
VPLNPNGLRLFSYPIETLRSTTMQNYIAGMGLAQLSPSRVLAFPPDCARHIRHLHLVSIPVRPRDLILLLVSLYASLISIRMIPSSF